MRTMIISCGTLKDEVEYIMDKYAVDCGFVWLERHFHETPKALHEKIQQAIDDSMKADKIILIYGNCGGTLNNIKATHCKLVVPKCEDCIQMMLYDEQNLNEMRRTSFFSSAGWLWGEEDLGYEYDRMKEKYGEKKALNIIHALYKNYKNFLFIKTPVKNGLYTAKRAEAAAIRLNLEFKTTQSNMTLIADLINGCEDERYLIVQKGGSIQF